MKNRRHSQQGATLIVSLIILAVISLLGVVSIRSSSLELRMANAVRDRALTFRSAETALMEIERQLRDENNRYSIASFMNACDPNASGRDWGAACFTPTCQDGFCFTGSIDGAMRRDECLVTNNTGNLVQPWRDTAIWTSPPEDRRYASLAVPLDELGEREQEVRYLVEFLCFVPPPPAEGRPVGRDGEANDLEPLYRITVRAESQPRSSVVMLQSTVSVPDVE